MQRLIAAAAGLAAALGASAALAQAPVAQDTYNFSYLLKSGTTDSGVLTGTLQSDGDTFDITGVKSFSVGGAPYAGPLAVESTDGSSIPTASLTKTQLNYFIGSEDTNDFLEFGVGDKSSKSLGGNFVLASSGFGGGDGFETFKPANYTASVTPAGGGGGGPEPSAWALMMVGVFGAGAALRRGKGEAARLAAA